MDYEAETQGDLASGLRRGSCNMRGQEEAVSVPSTFLYFNVAFSV